MTHDRKMNAITEPVPPMHTPATSVGMVVCAITANIRRAEALHVKHIEAAHRRYGGSICGTIGCKCIGPIITTKVAQLYNNPYSAARIYFPPFSFFTSR